MKIFSCNGFIKGRQNICEQCEKYSEILNKKVHRLSSEKQVHKINLTLLSKMELHTRCEELIQEKRLHKQSIKRLELRLKNEIVNVTEHDDIMLSECLKRSIKDKPINQLPLAIQLLLLSHDESEKNKIGKQKRWHPLLIRWCLRTYCQSKSAYKQLQESLGLPSTRCLDDYKNAWKNGSGWQEAKFMKLREEKDTYQLTGSKLFGCITIDEMTINQGICWNPEGDIVGLQDIDTVDIDIKSMEKYLSQLDNTDNILSDDSNIIGQRPAKKVLQLALSSLLSDYTSFFVFFATTDLKAKSLYDILIEATGRLAAIGWRIIAWCGDNASSNQSCWKYTLKDDNTITNNPFTGDPLWMLQCIPHTLKTTRNAVFESSNYHSARRRLMRRGRPILWKHFKDVLFADNLRASKENPTGIKVTKLKEAHISLTTYSKMNNRLAEETIASKSVAEEMARLDINSTKETVHLINLMSTVLAIFQDPRPVREVSDERLILLESVLTDLEEWNFEINAVDEPVKIKKKFFLPKPTWFAWNLILKNIPKMIRWLLITSPNNYISLPRLKNLQNRVENRFSGQREQGRTNTNPTLKMYGHNDLSLDILGQSFLVSNKSNAPIATKSKDKLFLQNSIDTSLKNFTTSSQDNFDTIYPVQRSPTERINDKPLQRRKKAITFDSKEWPIKIQDSIPTEIFSTEISSISKFLKMLSEDWKIKQTELSNIIQIFQSTVDQTKNLELFVEHLNYEVNNIYLRAIIDSKNREGQISEKKSSAMWHTIISKTHLLTQANSGIVSLFWIMSNLGIVDAMMCRMFLSVSVLLTQQAIEFHGFHNFQYSPSTVVPNIEESISYIDESEQKKIRYIGGWVIFTLTIKHKKSRSLDELKIFEEMVQDIKDTKDEIGRRYREVVLNQHAIRFLFNLEILLRTKYLHHISPTQFDSKTFHTIHDILSVDLFLREAWKTLIENILTEKTLAEEAKVRCLQLYVEKYLRSRSKNFLLHTGLLPESKVALRKHLQENQSKQPQSLITYNNVEELLKLSSNSLTDILKELSIDDLFKKFKKNYLQSLIGALKGSYKNSNSKLELAKIFYKCIHNNEQLQEDFIQTLPKEFNLERESLPEQYLSYNAPQMIQNEILLEDMLQDPDLQEIYNTPLFQFVHLLSNDSIIN